MLGSFDLSVSWGMACVTNSNRIEFQDLKPLGYVWIKDLVKEKKMEMEKLRDHWIINIIFSHQILDPNTAFLGPFEYS